MKIKALNSRGVIHHLALVIVVLGVAIGGTGYLVASHADAPLSTYQIQTQYQVCMSKAGVFNKTGQAACSLTEQQEIYALQQSQIKPITTTAATPATVTAQALAATTNGPSTKATPTYTAPVTSTATPSTTPSSSNLSTAVKTATPASKSAATTNTAAPATTSRCNYSPTSTYNPSSYCNTNSGPTMTPIRDSTCTKSYLPCPTGTTYTNPYIPPAVPGQTVVVGSSVYYDGRYIGDTGEQIFTQAQYDALTAAQKAALGAYAIVPADDAAAAGGKWYKSNSNGENDAGLTVQNGNVYYDGTYVGPTGSAIYTQAQYNALTPAQKKAIGNSYTIVTNEALASLANGQVYNNGMGGYNTTGAPISNAQYKVDKTQCTEEFGLGNTNIDNCISNLEDCQEYAAENGSICTTTAAATRNTGTKPPVSTDQYNADVASCTKALAGAGTSSKAMRDCVGGMEKGQHSQSKGNGSYKHVEHVTVNGKKEVVTVTVDGNGKTTVTTQKAGSKKVVTTKVPASVPTPGTLGTGQATDGANPPKKNVAQKAGDKVKSIVKDLTGGNKKNKK